MQNNQIILSLPSKETMTELLDKVRLLEQMLMRMAESGQPELPLTQQRAIELYGFRESTFKQLRRKGVIPSYKIGKSNIWVFASEIN